MTASKAIAIMAGSEDIASISCYRNLTMILSVFCWSVSGVSIAKKGNIYQILFGSF
jgi:hypothetical protein